MPDFTLYGIALTALILGFVKLLQDRGGLSDGNADLLRAFLAVGAFLVIENAALFESLWPWFETVVKQVLGAVGVFLAVLGYWSEVRQVGYRVQGLPPKA